MIVRVKKSADYTLLALYSLLIHLLRISLLRPRQPSWVSLQLLRFRHFLASRIDVMRFPARLAHLDLRYYLLFHRLELLLFSSLRPSLISRLLISWHTKKLIHLHNKSSSYSKG